MIRNRATLEKSDRHDLALECVESAIAAAAPENVTQSQVSYADGKLSIAETTYDLTEYRDILVVGGGKAAGGVVESLESILGERITDGLVITKHPAETEHVRCVTGDHPLPSKTNIEATDEVFQLVRSVDSDTLVLFVVTGGSSALLTSPSGDLILSDIQETTNELLGSGATIQEMNVVRKHLSDVKGGQFARVAAPATVGTLILSDVVGDDLSAIGSGPTVPDDSTYADALAVLDQYDIRPPASVSDHLSAGDAGQIPGMSFAEDSTFDGVTNHLIGDNRLALDAARAVCDDAGYEPIVLTPCLHGEAREVATTILAIAEEIAATGNLVEPPAVLLAGGECTVSISGDGGQGGPNQEFILSSALNLDSDIVLAAVDTDGEDGSSEMAGAIADHETVTDPKAAIAALDRNDAGTYLSDVGATIRTAPTGTNVNDVVVAVVPETVSDQ